MQYCPWCGRAINEQTTICPYADCRRVIKSRPECSTPIPAPPPAPGTPVGEMRLPSPPLPGFHAGETPLPSPPPPGSYAGETALHSPPPPGGQGAGAPLPFPAQPGAYTGQMPLPSPPPPGSYAGDMRFPSPPAPASFAAESPLPSPPPPVGRNMEIGTSIAIPDDRANEMHLPSPPPPNPLSWASAATPEAPLFASTNPPDTEPHATSFEAEEGITLNVQAEDLLNRLRLGRRRRAAMATAASALVVFSIVCGTIHCVYNVLGYAELTSEMTFGFDPLAPECIVLAYRPTRAGYFVLRREGGDRTTEFFDEIPEEEVGHEQTLLWQVNGLRNGELLTVRYRQGWNVVTQEWTVPQSPPTGVSKNITAD